MLKVIISLLFLLLASPVLASDFSEADARAKTVPAQYENNLDSLVRYLIAPYKQDDVLKTRVLYAWIVYHIEYDMFKYDVISEKKRVRNRNKTLRTGDAFKTRVGVCADIADLFSRMAKIAGIKEEQISGYAGYDLTMNNFKDNGHAWNAVYIKNKWLFIDATWGMDGDYKTFENIRSAGEHKKEIRKKKYQKNREVDSARSIDNKWFLVEPEEFIKTHFPKREKQQHLKRAVDMKKVFRENLRKAERKK